MQVRFHKTVYTYMQSYAVRYWLKLAHILLPKTGQDYSQTILRLFLDYSQTNLRLFSDYRESSYCIGRWVVGVPTQVGGGGG